MSIRAESSKPRGHRKMITALHVGLMVLALLGCGMNIAYLVGRREKVCAELSEQFRAAFIRQMIASAGAPVPGAVPALAVPAADSAAQTAATSATDPAAPTGPEMVVVDFGVVYAGRHLDQRLKIATNLHYTDEVGVAVSQRLSHLVGKLVEFKLANPFLFGFVDVGAEVAACLTAILLGDKRHEDELLLWNIKGNIENYFLGRLDPEKYRQACAVAILCLSRGFHLENQPVYPSLVELPGGQSPGSSELVSWPHAISREEYFITASYLGEICTRLLGHPIPAKEFAAALAVPAAAFDQNRVKQVLNYQAGYTG